jgi:hypothetical protein
LSFGWVFFKCFQAGPPNLTIWRHIFFFIKNILLL